MLKLGEGLEQAVTRGYLNGTPNPHYKPPRRKINGDPTTWAFWRALLAGLLVLIVCALALGLAVGGALGAGRLAFGLFW